MPSSGQVPPSGGSLLFWNSASAICLIAAAELDF
jgi:hypothetical protein